MENIPDHLSFHADSRPHLPLSAGFHALLDQAKYSLEVVSPVWDLNAWDAEAKQVRNAIISEADLRGTLLMRSTPPRRLRVPHPSTPLHTPSPKKLELLRLHSDGGTVLSPHQGQLLFQRLLRLASRGVKLRIVSGPTASAELTTLAEHGERLVASRVHVKAMYETVKTEIKTRPSWQRYTRLAERMQLWLQSRHQNHPQHM